MRSGDSLSTEFMSPADAARAIDHTDHALLQRLNTLLCQRIFAVSTEFSVAEEPTARGFFVEDL